jgi:hypothetical protein
MAYYAFANLEEEQLQAVKSLETRIGRPLVAMKPVEMRPAELDDGTLSAVKELESKLGVALVAVDR